MERPLPARLGIRKREVLLMEKNVTKNSNELSRGVKVFIALAVLTVIEYFLGVWEVPSILLWIIAL
jgi:hypothetical protein